VSIYLSVAEEVYQNNTAAQKELLKWHWRLGYTGLRWIQWLAATPRTRPDGNEVPIIQPKNEKMSSCNLPLCAACQVAKQERRGPEVPRQVKVENKDHMLRRNHLCPGDMVSVDQYVSALPGHLPHTKGEEMKKDQYCGGTIFVDHASSKVFIKHQISLNAGETAMGKRMFKRDAMGAGV
jgi:hypothetical protein